MISITKLAVIGIITLSLYITQQIEATVTHNSLRNLHATHHHQQQQERYLEDNCLDNLSSVAEEGSNEVTAQEFLAFLLLQSDGRDDYETFSDIPLDLRLLFYATACSGGQDCTTSSPTISLDREGMASTLLQIFCAQVEKILEEPVDSLKVSFRYNLYYKTDFTLQEIMARDDDSTIVYRLETATERVVSSALGCPLDSARQLEHQSNDSTLESIRVQPLYKDEPLQLFTVLTEREVERCSRHLQTDCMYDVKAVVEDMIQHGTSTECMCVLVSFHSYSHSAFHLCRL